MENKTLPITCHPGADHAMDHSFADSTVPGVISTNDVFDANTNIVPVEAADISDKDNTTNAVYKTCLQKRIDGEIDILIDHSNTGKELSDENSGELLPSRYGNGNDVNKIFHSCQLCEECDCPESPVNLKYPKLCDYCAHYGYCQDDCLKERKPGILVPCTDYDCREFQTDECRLCGVFTNEVFVYTPCEETENDLPW